MCQGGMLTPAAMCTGTGTCGTVTATSCHGYSCISPTMCGTHCNAGTGTGCEPGYVCTGGGSNGTCVGNLGPGSPCTANSECKNGMCLPSDAGADAGSVCN
jgi:hypothetical protein